jgi:putative Holliday junction resolvase
MSAFPGRVLAIDWGEARIGVAQSDPTRRLATPHSTLFEKDKRRQIERVVALVVELEATLVLVGLPLHMDGKETTTTRPATKFAEKLAGLVAVPVELVDERLSSAVAEARLAEAGKKAGRKDKGRIDSEAAAVLLQEWLDAAERREAP